MSNHTMKISEPDPHHPGSGFFRYYYATIDVAIPANQSGWIWRQVDLYGNYLGNASASYKTERDALDAALKFFNGDDYVDFPGGN